MLIFGVKAHLINTQLLVPRSGSSAKVKGECQGNISLKMAVLGALLFYNHILFCIVRQLDQGSMLLTMPIC